MESYAAYISMLQARRLEDESSRLYRSQRRADVVISNAESFKQRSIQARRVVMEEKLKMTSEIEYNLFCMLDEQSKWRHVMYQNVKDRHKQHDEMRVQQQKLHEDHLQSLTTTQAEIYKETIRDDERRWEKGRQVRKAQDDKRVYEDCRESLDLIMSLTQKTIQFAEAHDLCDDPSMTQPFSMFDCVPNALFQHWKEEAVYGEGGALERVVDAHVSLTDYTSETVPRDETFNPMFCALTKKLRDVQRPQRAFFRPIQPSPKAIVVVHGPKYSGKTKAAKNAAENHNLVYAADTDLVTEALQELEKDFDPSDERGEFASQLIDLGVVARKHLQDGEAIPQSLLAQLVLLKIKSLPDECRGLILDGIPKTEEVFEVIETELSGYDRNVLQIIPEEVLAPYFDACDAVDKQMFILEKPDVSQTQEVAPTKEKKSEAKAVKKDKKKDEVEEPLPPVELPHVEPVPPLTEEELQTLARAEAKQDIAGLSGVVYMDCTESEIFKRFAGIRVDFETGDEYHVEFFPPPLDIADRVFPKDRTEGDAAKLHCVLQEHGEIWHKVQKFVSQYSNLLLAVDANGNFFDVIGNVDQAVGMCIDKCEKQFEKFFAADELKKQRQELEALFTERSAQREKARKQLAVIYNERGVDPLPVDLVEPPKPVDPNKTLPIPSGLAAMFLKMLRDFTSFYSNTIFTSHQQIASTLDVLFEDNSFIFSQFNHYWEGVDQRDEVLGHFVRESNQMQPDLRRDPQGKEELHFRVDHLMEQLHQITERRRDDCNQLIETLTNHVNFLDGWSDSIRIIGASLIQAEVERFLLVKQLTLMYFCGVKTEEYRLDEVETTTDILPVPRGVGHDPTTPDPATVKGKEKKAPPAKKAPAKQVHDDAEQKPEDLFAPVLEKAFSIVRTATDRLTHPQSAPGGDKKTAPAKKGAAVEPVAEVTSVGANALPIVSSEMELAKKRIDAIAAYVQKTLQAGENYAAVLKAKMKHKLKARFASEISAVNAAMFHVRCAVEEERAVSYAIHLAGDKLLIDQGCPLEMKKATKPAEFDKSRLDQSAKDETAGIMLTSCLSYARCMEMIATFKVIAPNFLLYRSDFLLVIHSSDYSIDLSPDQLFSRFDVMKCDILDWREFITHLLLWSEGPSKAETPSTNVAEDGGAFGEGNGNTYYVEGPSLFQLSDLRESLDVEKILEEEFLDMPLYFESNMEVHRANSYKSIFWEMFNAPDFLISEETNEPVGDAVNMLDPNAFLLFLCADEQPLRGVQKAFAVAAPIGEEVFSLTKEAIYDVFHFNSCDASKLGMYDPYQMENIQAIFDSCGNPEALSFQDVCATHVGRLLLNNTQMYLRRNIQ